MQAKNLIWKDKLKKVIDKLKNNGKIKVGISQTHDFAEIKAYLKNNYDVDVADDVMELDFKKVKLSLTGVERIITEFPQAKTMLKNISTKNDGVMCASYDGTINFNPNYYGKNNI